MIKRLSDITNRYCESLNEEGLTFHVQSSKDDHTDDQTLELHSEKGCSLAQETLQRMLDISRNLGDNDEKNPFVESAQHLAEVTLQ